MTGRPFKKEYLIIGIFMVMNLILHLVADFNSGFHGDELLHIEAGRHVAAGFMDFPPLISYLAFIQNLFHSDSILVNHLFVHIASSLIFLFCGLIVIGMGGGWLAVVVALSCILFSPGLGASYCLFLPVVFEQLSWVLCIFFFMKYLDSGQNKYLAFLGIAAGFGFLAKYSMSFLVFGMMLSVILIRWKLLREKPVWISVFLFLLIISQNLTWQFRQGFPVIHHVSKLYETQLGHNSAREVFQTMFLYLNPFTAVFWIGGLLIVPFLSSFKKFRMISFALLFTFSALVLARSKAYYYFPVILAVFPAGAILFEKILEKRKWILLSWLLLLCISGALLLPGGIPLLPLEKYVSLYHRGKNDGNRTPLPFENYYSAPVWARILAKVHDTYLNLPAAEQKNCLIWGRHYSQAGGIDLLGKKYNLPHAFSFHGSFYNWVPRFSKDITVIVISDASWDKEHWLRFFTDVAEVGRIENPYASDAEWNIQHIFLCRNLVYNSAELKNMFRNEVF